MVEKRPGEELDDFSLKQPRYSEPGDHAISNLDTLGENVAQVHHDLVGEDGGHPAKVIHHCNGKVNDCHKAQAELLTFTDKEMETGAPGSLSNSSWATSTTSEEDNGSEAAFRIFLPPDYYNIEDPVSIILHQRDLYYSLLEFSPQKLVPLGSEFQAEIPECGADTSVKLSSSFGDSLCLLPHSSELHTLGSSYKYNKFAGTCVIPMPEIEVGNEEKPGSGRTVCSCEDVGSIRCVKQHIGEARLKLRMTVGTETFCKLGFDDMGEVVADKWSEEEKEIFHDLIYSNPASLGMNFWDHLATAFPSRKKEIVSYYFNVFILRKRAEQNRCNLSNIDSDNDELEANDLSADEVLEKINEDNDVVSELQGAKFIGKEIHEENIFEKDDVGHTNLGDTANVNFSRNGVIDSETTSDDMVDHSISNPSARLVLFDEKGAHDVQNAFCTTHKGEHAGHDVQDGPSDVYDRGDLDGPGVQNGTFNACVDGEPHGHGCQNGVSTVYENGKPVAFTSEKANCNENWMHSSSWMSSKDGQEPDLQGFPQNEDFLLPTRSVIDELFSDCGCHMKTSHA